MTPIMMDPPEHTVLRAPLQKTFSPRTVLAMKDKIEALAISRKILAANPGVAKYQQDLTAILDRSGDLAMMAGDAAGAQAALLESYELTKTLAAAEPDNADVQLNLVSSLVRVARFDADRSPRLQEALEVLQRLQGAGRLDPAKQGWIGMVQAMLAQNSPAP